MITDSLQNGMRRHFSRIGAVFGAVAVASQSVDVVAAAVPSLGIAPVEASKVNPSTSIVLEATVGPNDAACVATWSLAEGATASGLSLQELALADTSKSIAAAASAQVPLVLAPAALTARSRYVFALEADCGAGGVAAGTISILTNGVPTSGTVAVTPDSGMSLETPFDIVARSWVDDDLPLTYSFFSRVGGDDAQIVAGTLSNSYDGAILPAGLEAVGFAVAVVAHVADAFGAVAVATTSVTVYPLSTANNADIAITDARLGSSLSIATLAPTPAPSPAPSAMEKCSATCYDQTCAYWRGFGYSCAELEGTYGCDCSGCECADDPPPDGCACVPDEEAQENCWYGDDVFDECDVLDECYGHMTEDACQSGFAYYYCDWVCECPADCHGYTCDAWAGSGYSCSQLEEYYGCDCSGCKCADSGDSKRDDKTSSIAVIVPVGVGAVLLVAAVGVWRRREFHKCAKRPAMLGETA